MKKAKKRKMHHAFSALLGQAPTEFLEHAHALGQKALAVDERQKERPAPRAPEEDRELRSLSDRVPGRMRAALRKAWLLGYGVLPAWSLVPTKPPVGSHRIPGGTIRLSAPAGSPEAVTLPWRSMERRRSAPAEPARQSVPPALPPADKVSPDI